MNANKSRVMRAQRKFAQGAYVPPSHNNNNNNLPARADLPQTTEEDKKIHNNLSAKNLLDIVSFQNIHKHLQPIVLLERLERSKDVPVQNGDETHIVKEPEPAPVQHRDKPELRNSPMSLRSGTIMSKIPGKPNMARKKLKRAKRTSSPILNKPKPKRAPEKTYSSSDIDDEKPLQYFKLNTQTKEMEVNRNKRPRETPRDMLVEAEIHEPPDMHKHLQPIVLLERLERSKDVPVQNGHENHNIVKEPEPALVQAAPVIHRDKPKLRLVARNSPMCLRSGTRINSKIYADEVAEDTRETRLKTYNEIIPALENNVNTQHSKEKSTFVERPDVPSTPASSDCVTPSLYYSVSDSLSPQFYGQNGIDKWMNSNSQPHFKTPPVPNQKTTFNHTEKSPSDDISESRRGASPCPSKRRYADMSESRRGASPCPSKRRYVDVSESRRGASSCPSKRRYVDVSESRHGASSCPSKRRYVDVSESRRGASPCSSKRRYVDVSESRRGASPCPSESLRTINDVVSASKQEMASRCHTCSHCGRVDKIKRISSLMQHPRSVANSDIYEFNADDERSAIIPQIYHGTRNSRTTTPTRYGEDDTLYLDILPNDSPHVIEMRSQNISGSSKRMMRARLILKSETQGKLSNDLFLVKHEKLLDRLLDTLSISDPSAPIKGISNDAKEPQPSTSQTVRTNKLATTKLTFPKNVDGAKLIDAPTFVPTEAEFNDPIAFFEKITPLAAKFGLCKVVAPKSFQPKCVLNDEMKFQVAYQYIARLYSRWGPAAREMTAIKAYLATQNIKFKQPPLIEGVEVNLQKLYLAVQRNGGLTQVLEKKRWGRVAEEMRLSLTTKPERTLDRFYVKHLLPYDTSSNQERKQIMDTVEKCWVKRNQKLVDWALNPLHRQKKLLDESDSSEDEDADDGSPEVLEAITEAEDCVVKGRTMKLAAFKKVAAKMVQTYFASPPTPDEVVKEYWRLVLLGTDHVCVNAASIDTGDGGYGFTKSKTDTWGKHPWNLKVISQNTGNVLRSLGAVLGVTLPTLHLGMVFSTSCWHRDPHGLPWIEFMHQGPSKIWYGIPNEQSSNFRKAVETLCPTSCQNKSIWLPSDITMIPPNLLLEQNVSLSHLVQNPGEFVIVFPKAYSSSISSGYTESESVYFATIAWLKTVHQVFQEVRASCEPTTFSLEQLLIAQAKDPRTSLGVLLEVHASLTTICNEELQNRRVLAEKNLKVSVQKRARNQPKKRPPGAWNVREQVECEVCRATLYLSKVTGLTGKKSSVCLQHAIRLLETPKHNKRTLDTVELVIYYPEEELEGIMAAVQERLFS